MPSDPPIKHPKRPTRLGKYEIIAHIATGGMGAVYKARDTELGREVALKILTAQTAANTNLLERFHREARHAAKLHHENIVTLYEMGEVNGTYFLAMEFVDGVDFYEYICRKGKLNPEEARQLLFQAARALEHAHQQGIVHRDIKPSNFILTRKNGVLIAKLTDMGLARESRDQECRVTRDGSTVGTIDYIAPEQALNSAAADIRSDIYALGCTYFHMVAGKPPFPDGSIGERVYKHLETQPPDIREFSPWVSPGMVLVLERMLAKKPEDRQQNPTELLRDLAQGRPTRSAGQQRDAGGDADTSRGTNRAAKPAGSSGELSRTRQRQDTVSARRQKTLPAIRKSQRWPLVAGGSAVAVLFVAVIGIIVWQTSAKRKGNTDQRVDATPTSGEPQRPPGGETIPKPEGPRLPEPAKPRWLYANAATVAAEPLRKELEQPWAAESAPAADTPILRVRRVGSAQATKTDFGSLAAACAAAPAQQTTIIEIHDNGPLFLPALVVKGRTLIVRARKGYRPLLVWDLGAPQPPEAANTRAFLSLTQGNLTLENLDLVLQRPNTTAGEAVSLVQVAEGDFLARDCTFSVAGKHRAGVAVIRLDSAGTPGAKPRAGSKCRLTRCLARGANLVALDLRAPGAEVLCDSCLIVGGDQPLVRVTAHTAPPTTVRVLRSTLVAGHKLLQVHGADSGPKQPALHWHGWDALLARSGDHGDSELVSLGEGMTPAAMRWQATNCLYAGWRTLLAGAGGNSVEARLDAWHRRWQRHEGDALEAAAWPAAAVHDPAEVAAKDFRTAGTTAGFTATSSPGTLGCDVTTLPPTRDNWLGLTYERLDFPLLDVPTGDAPPEIPNLTDGRYHGGRLDVGQIDLGAYLLELQKTTRLGPKVVLHLYTTGDARRTRPTSLIHVKDSSLTLYFEPIPDSTETLILTPSNALSPNQDALIKVENGDLEIQGGEIRFPNFARAIVPAYLLKVRGGDLRLHGCRLQGPLSLVPLTYRGLIHFEGVGAATPDKTPGCVVNETILVSSRTCVHMAGTDVRIRLRQNVLVAGTEAIFFEPGAGAQARLNLYGLLENNTIAAQGALFRLGDVPQRAVPLEPLVIMARANVFLCPFAPPHRAAMVHSEGEAFARGLLSWQGEGNVYDKRLLPLTSVSLDQPLANWSALWGTPGDRLATPLDMPPKSVIKFDVPQLELLALPQGRFKRPFPGADLVQLGILKKRP